MFRPSDDATFYPYLISSNMFAVVSLRQISEIFKTIFSSLNIDNQFIELANEVDEAIKNYAIFDRKEFGKIYALEIDGFEMHFLWMMPMFRICSQFRIWDTLLITMKFIKIPENFL
jgi:meiotically up-regulated gene 157 (Mug157) protein